MQMSENAYQKAKEILNWIIEHPNEHMGEIADAVDMLKASAHIIVQKMVRTDVLTFTTKRHRGGKRHYYQATGKNLPQRVPVKRTRVSQIEEQTLNAEPLPVDEYQSLPSFMRALTPAIEPHPINAVAFFGHTKEQHQRQSAIIRKERGLALRGVVYSGEPRL